MRIELGDDAARSRCVGYSCALLRRTAAAAALFIVLFLAVLTPSGQAASQCQVLKSFGILDQSGAQPYDSLVLASDGVLYGTTYSGGARGVGTVFKMNPDGAGYHILHHFRVAVGDGSGPYAKLTEASDETLYGTTWAGGSRSRGTVFKLNKDGTGYEVLHSFTGSAGDGANPFTTVIEGTNGALFGTTYYGGSNAAGMIFRMNKDGSSYAILHTFGILLGDGHYPSCELLQAKDGLLYGTASSGGTNNAGVIFRLATDGSSYTIIHNFTTALPEGQTPPEGLIEGNDGRLYGMTYAGGSNNLGTVFAIDKDGTGYTSLHSFGPSGADGANPEGGLIQGVDGALYGTTAVGGNYGVGIVFKVQSDGTGYTVLHHFDGAGGQNPEAAVLMTSTGTLYGTAEGGGSAIAGVAFALGSDGRGYTVLENFSATGGDGFVPSGLSRASNGQLYGTCFSGGSGLGGTIFRLDKDSLAYAILYNFSSSGPNQAPPRGPVVEGSDGAMYGVFAEGGTNLSGALFKLNKDGSSFAVIHSFGADATDGTSPLSPPTSSSDGWLYGTTSSGGTSAGTIYKIDTNGGSYTILHSFDGSAGEGIGPEAPLLRASDSALYGTTWESPGAVFKLYTNGTGFSVLHAFSASGGDGFKSNAGLIEGSDGFLYGTTTAGGTNNVGTVFRIGRDGANYAVLYHFGGSAADGQSPSGGLLEGRDGALYGTTLLGGSNGAGTVFRLLKDGGDYSVIYDFGTGIGDGLNPVGPLLQLSDGAFYGACQSGGAMNYGVVFRLSPPQTPTMVSAISLSNGVSVSFTGMSSYLYQLQRSNDLTNWTSLATVRMPSTGLYLYQDTNSTWTAAFYRAAWEQ